MNAIHHDVEGTVEQAAGVLGVEALNQLGRALKIGEQHSDVLALAFEGDP